MVPEEVIRVIFLEHPDRTRRVPCPADDLCDFAAPNGVAAVCHAVGICGGADPCGKAGRQARRVSHDATQYVWLVPPPPGPTPM